MRSFRNALPALIIATLFRSALAAGAPAGNAPTSHPPTSDLLIDPLLIAQAAEVWSVVATDENRVWPGWNARATPLLFYLPGQQDVLINHPNPPAGFEPYTGPLTFPGGRIQLHTGKTLIDFDGQNTSRDINGVRTLVVADTLSNRKQNIDALVRDPRPADEKLANIEYSAFSADPYDTLALIAHEAFHVYQNQRAPDKGGNELALIRYPTLSVDNTVGFALEGAALADALRAPDDARFRAAALRWLAVRRDRRAKLTPADSAYEDGTEFNEGLAKYVEYRLMQVLESRTPGPAMHWTQGFHGYADLRGPRAHLIDMLLRHMRGEVNVNNDPYGASPLRMRLYFSGMAIGALLDRLVPDWHERIFQPDATLTGLAEATLAPASADLQNALAEARRAADYADLVQSKTKLESDGRARAAAMVREIQDGPNTLLTVDYSHVEKPQVAMSFTPFGIVAVDDQRTIFRMLPIKARIGTTSSFEQTRAAPLLQDRQQRRLSFQLSKLLTHEEFLAAVGGKEPPREPQALGHVELPGVDLNLGRATLAWSEHGITVTLYPEAR